MPLPRMTTRRWMIAVAVVGIALALPRWTDHYCQYKERSAGHGRMKASLLAEVREIETRRAEMQAERIDVPNDGCYRYSAETLQVLKDWVSFHESMERECARAAYFPWISIPRL